MFTPDIATGGLNISCLSNRLTFVRSKYELPFGRKHKIDGSSMISRVIQTSQNHALRWLAHEPSNELKTFLKINRARNYSDFNEALTTYKYPGQNFVFAANNNFAQSLKTHFLYAKNLHDNNSTKTRQSLYHIEIQFVIKFFTLIYFNCISNDNENIR